MTQRRYSSDYKAIQPFVVEDVRRILGAAGGAAAAGGSGGGIVAHALSDAAIHTGQLAQAQASWAATKTELTDHAGDMDAHHARLHNIISSADHTVTGGAGQVVGLTGTNTLGLLTPTAGLALSGSNIILASTVAGNGLTYTSGVLDIGQGDGVTVGANAIALASTVAGSGLTYTDGVLDVGAGAGLTAAANSIAVGAGAGITVNADDVALTTPGTLTVSTTNDASGNHKHAVASSSNVATSPAASLLASDSAGGLALKTLVIGTVDETTGVGNLDFAGHAVISTARSAYLFLDDDNNSTGAAFIIGRDGANTTTATTLFTFTETGRLLVGPAMTLSGTNDAGTEPDIQFAGHGLIAAESGLYINIDSNNDSTSAALIVQKNAATSAGTQIMALNESGWLTVLDRVRVPTIDTASGHLTLSPADDLLLSPGSNLVKLQNGVSIGAHDYASQLTGWRITEPGAADFRYVYTDEMHAKAFIADLEQALAGGQIITKSVTLLASDFTAPAAGGTASLHVKDLPSAPGMAVFQSGDIIRLRQFSRAGGSLSITNCWGVVTNYVDVLDGSQLWTFTRSTSPNAGLMSTGAVVAKDAIVLDYGTSGNGFHEVNAIDGLYAANSPYSQIVTWTTHPATGQAVRVRTGNLYGLSLTPLIANEYGLYAGNGTGNDDAWLRISNQAVKLNNLPFELSTGGVVKVSIAAWNDVWLGPSSSDKRLSWNGTTFAIEGQVTATSGYIGTAAAGWTITSNSLQSANIRLLAGSIGRVEVGDYTGAGGIPNAVAGLYSATVATGTAIWAGASATNRATAPFRVNLQGDLYASSADITGAITANTGYIGGASGWTIASGLLSSSNVRLYSGSTTLARLELGDGTGANTAGVRGGDGTASAVAFWAGAAHVDRATAPFRVYLDGDLVASNADIAGTVRALTGYFGGTSATSTDGWTVASGLISSSNIRLYSGGTSVARIELGTGTTALTSGMFAGTSVAATVAFWAGAAFADRATAPFRAYMDGSLVATNANITGIVTANTGYIGGTGGWTVASGLISSTNIKLYSGDIYTARVELGDGTAARTAGIRAGGGTATDTAFWAGSAHTNTAAAPFRVTLAGAVYATDAYIEGDVIADTGYIGGTSGWTIATGKISSGNIELRSGAAGVARIDLGLTGMVGSPSAASINIWAGSAYANMATAPFRVYDNGAAIISALTISGDSNVTGNLYAGSNAVRFGADGQRLVLPNTTGISVPTSSSAIRWFPTIGGAHDYTKNYTGLVGYRHTGINAVDMLYTSFVGSTDAATYDARMILQAGHQTGSDSSTYSDTLLVITREKGAGAKTINAICDTFSASAAVYVTGNCSAASFTDRTPWFNGDGLAALRGVKGKKGEIDHSTLPAFARRKVRTMDGKEEEGRDLGAMISILIAAVGQLEAKLAALEGRR